MSRAARAALKPPASSSPAMRRVSTSPLAASRAHGWFGQLAQAWAKRTEPSEDGGKAVSQQMAQQLQSILAAQQVVHAGVMHQHAGTVLDMIEAATATWRQKGKQTPTAALTIPTTSTAITESDTTTTVAPASDPAHSSSSSVSPAVASGASAAVPAASSGASPTTFQLAPSTYYLLLRLLLLLAQRLPEFYAGHWKAADPDSLRPLPLPAGTDVDSYRRFFARVRKVGEEVLEETLADTRQRHEWDARFSCAALHLQILSLFHSPSATGDPATLAFWEWFEERALPNSWFATQLTQYDQLKELLQCLGTALAAEGDLHRTTRLTVDLVRTWRAVEEEAKLASAPAPHDTAFTVRGPPPSFSQHESLMSFTSLMTSLVLKEAHDANASDDETVRTNVGVVELFCEDLLSESRTQFETATAPPPQGRMHRALLPVFSLLGLLQAAEGDARLTQLDGVAQAVSQARSDLRHMVHSVLDLPEIASLVRQSTASIADPTSRPTWPCVNHLEVPCPSCLFVLLVSGTLVHATRIMPDLLIEAPSSDQSTTKASTPSQTLLTGTMLITSAFLHLIDYTWVLNGDIQLANTPPPTPVPSMPSSAPSSSSSASPSSLASEKAADAADPPRLFAWITSSFFVLLPQYTRCLSSLFLQLRDRPSELAVLAMVWQRTQYIHVVWSWYDAYGGGASIAEDATTKKAPKKPTGPELEKALERVRRSAMMQPTNNPVDLVGERTDDAPPAPKLPLTEAAAPLRLTPTRLTPSTLKRAHASMFMSVIMLLSTIVRDEAWRGSFTDSSASESVDARLSVGATQQSYAVSLVIDIVANLEFVAGAVARDGGFAPYKEVLEIIIALVTGREIQNGTTLGPSASSQAVRDEFAHSTLAFYVRCFLRPSYGAQQENPSHFPVDRFLGLDSGSEAVAAHLARIGATRPRHVALPFLLAASQVPFAPCVLAHATMCVPLMSQAWPPLCDRFSTDADSSLVVARGEDAPCASRALFIAGLLAGASKHVAWSLQWHFLLPWSFSLASTRTVASLNKRAQHLLVATLQHGYNLATGAVADTNIDLSSAHPPLPSPPVGAQLESFVRSLLPFVVSRSLAAYPSVVTFPSLLDTFLLVFVTLPPHDLLLLALLRDLRDRAADMLRAISKDETRLKRWREVTRIDTEVDVADASSSGEELVVHGLSGAASRLPRKFPSLTSIRRLLLLFLQVMQVVDAPLYPRALALLDELLTTTLSPSSTPLSAPLRGTVIALVHESVSRGFDQSKRDATAEWLVQLVQRLRIPTGVRLDALEPDPASVAVSDDMRRTIERLQAAAAQTQQARNARTRTSS